MPHDDSFITKYRPLTLDEVIGQEATVQSLREIQAGGAWPHSFVFTGSSGTGKTSLSRIVARAIGCTPENILEVDAATYGGADELRQLMTSIQYVGIGANAKRALILDEAHVCSKTAFQAVLKTIEEPPPHAYFFFCTTEESKIPRTIETRSHVYRLKPVGVNALTELLMIVRDVEGLTSLDDACLQLIAQESQGSPRQALVWLSQARGCQSTAEVGQVIEATAATTEVIDFARLVIRDRFAQSEWPMLRDLLVSLKDQNAESVRLTVVHYLSAAALKAGSYNEAGRILSLLACFSVPYNQADGLAPLLLSVYSRWFTQ